MNSDNTYSARVVVGQSDFISVVQGGGESGLNYPNSSVYTDGNKLYVPDSSNNRILVFNSIPTMNGAMADYAIGQSNLTNTAAGLSASSFNFPRSPLLSGGKFFMADFWNNRVAIYNSDPAGSPGTMDVVVGQANKTSKATDCTASGMNYPYAVSVAGNKMVVADTQHNRVLIWDSIPTTDGTPADLVIGQADMTNCGAQAVASDITNFPTDVWTDGNRLIVMDFSYNRVLIWNSFPTSNGQAADLVLGQPDFNNGFWGTSATSLRQPSGGIFVDSMNRLFLADSGNNRVLVWNNFPTSNGQAADLVLGQPNFTVMSPGAGVSKLSFPTGVHVVNDQIFITDTMNNRVVVYAR